MHALLLAPTTFRFTLPMLLRHNIIAPTPNHNNDDALVANANARLQGKRTLGVCNFKNATLRAVCCPETSAYARRTLGVRSAYADGICDETLCFQICAGVIPALVARGIDYERAHFYQRYYAHHSARQAIAAWASAWAHRIEGGVLHVLLPGTSGAFVCVVVRGRWDDNLYHFRFRHSNQWFRDRFPGSFSADFYAKEEWTLPYCPSPYMANDSTPQLGSLHRKGST